MNLILGIFLFFILLISCSDKTCILFPEYSKTVPCELIPRDGKSNVLYCYINLLYITLESISLMLSFSLIMNFLPRLAGIMTSAGSSL